VAKGGWICCGGENGEFTIIREVGPRTSSPGTASASDDNANRDPSDTLLTSDSSASPAVTAEASMTELRRDMLNIVEQITGGVKVWSASNYKFGSQRVNCITIWQPPKPPSDYPRPGRYTTPVAVLANNDRTVTIVNLHDGEAIDELEYPDFVNRSVISPDGSLLIAICDDPFLYIHIRCPVQGRRGGCDWVQLPRIRLKGQSVRDLSDCRGSFAACFSPSGRYLAVGTQYGTISIFDVAAFADPAQDPLVTYFNSARAPTDSGAVRDMAFSPGPYDILAWTEHRGRIGVADARTNFTKRQIISIEDHTGYEHILLSDRNTTIDPRLLDPRSERSAASSSFQSFLGQGPRMPGPSGLSGPPGPDNSDTSRFNHSFTPEESAILEAVQSDRRRREAREVREAREQRDQRDLQTARGSAAWRSSVFAERVSPQQGMSNVARERDRDISERLRYLTSLQRDTLTRIFEREQNRDRDRDLQRDILTRVFEREQSRENRDHQRPAPAEAQAQAQAQTSAEQDRERRAPTPRRRSSIMQTLTDNSSSIQQTLSRLQRLGYIEGTGSSLDSFPSTWGQPRSTSGWADLEALYNNASGDISGIRDGTGAETSNRIRRAIPVISDVWNDDGSTGIRRTYGRIASRDHPQHADDTAGLAWSEDGRTL